VTAAELAGRLLIDAVNTWCAVLGGRPDAAAVAAGRARCAAGDLLLVLVERERRPAEDNARDMLAAPVRWTDHGADA